MIDTHCHIFSEYYDNIDELILKIKESGVKKIIVNGTDMKSNIEVLDLIKKYDIVYGAIGFQPTELDEFKEDDIDWLEEHINDEKIVAIGEIGLDYHYDNTDKDEQQYIFKKQLEIAEKHNKPVIVHTRDSIQDTYNILSKYKVCGSIHCYSGSVEMAREFIKLGYKLGIGGVLTFKNSKLYEVIEEVDLKNILLETDSPYLSPEPNRGKTNIPSNIYYVAKRIAEIKNIKVEEVIDITTKNARELFKI